MKISLRLRSDDFCVDIAGYNDDGSVIFTPGISFTDTVWNIDSHYNRHGDSLRSKIAPDYQGDMYSPYLIEDLVSLTTTYTKNAVVLSLADDSCAVARAVIRNNDKDHGQRQCITIINDEDVFDDVSWPLLNNFLLGVHDYGAGDTRPILGDYEHNKVTPFSYHYDTNIVAFDIAYLKPAVMSITGDFSSVYPLMWMQSGALGDISSLSVGGVVVAGKTLFIGRVGDIGTVTDALSQYGGEITQVFDLGSGELVYDKIIHALDNEVISATMFDSYRNYFSYGI